VDVTVSDVAVNAVRLTLAGVGLKGNEFLGANALLLNLDPFPSNLRAKFLHGRHGAWRFAQDGFTRHGRGPLDARLNLAQRLRKGQRSVWLLKGTGLSTADILGSALGEPDAIPMASFVQGIPGPIHTSWITVAFAKNASIGDTSGPVVSSRLAPDPVPLPGALWLFGGTLTGLGLLSKRARNAKVAIL
jgi:hypothetical protein